MKFDDDTCSKNIKSLSMKQARVIERVNENENPNYSNDDVFLVNEKFTS
jgi:hypothetical protein